MRDNETEIYAKGQNFRTMLRILEQTQGRDAAENALRELTGQVRDALQFGEIVANGWYPVAWYRELHRAMQHACHSGPEMARMLGRHASIVDFNGIHHIVLRMLSTETVFNQAPRLMKIYFRGGTAEKVTVKKGLGRVRFGGWRGFDRSIWEDIIGSCEGILTVCGAKRVASRVLSGGQDHEGMDLELVWT